MNYEKRKCVCGFFILLRSTFILSDCRVSPGECGLTSSDGDPGTNGVILKTRCGAWNKEHQGTFASGDLAEPSLRRFRPATRKMSIFSENTKPALSQLPRSCRPKRG